MQNPLTILRDAWRLGRPFFTSSERWFALGVLAAVVAMNLVLVGLDVVLSYWNNEFFNTLQDKDWEGFVALLFTWHRSPSGAIMPGFTGLVIVYIALAVYRTYLRQWLQIRWRRWMTERFLNEWLADRAYYRMSLIAVGGDGIGTDNPDQRISEDLRDYVDSTLALGLDLLSNIVSLISFLGVLWALSGSLTVLGVTIPGYMVWVALLYAALGTWLTHRIGRPLTALNFMQQRVEADFRYSLVRLRENIEGVALYAGEAEEQRGLASRFSGVMANWWRIMQRTKLLNALIFSYNQIANVFPIVVAAPRYFFGTMKLGDLTQTAQAFGQVQGSMSWFVTSYSSLASYAATVERLATFHRAIVAARASASQGVTAEVAGAAGGYGLEDATIALPNGHALLEHATLALEPGRSVVVTGRSGSGKSTLFRTFAGIWPFGTGHVRRPPGTALFLPQRPYIPLGTLRHAVTYPAASDAFPDSELREVLTAVGLGQLVDQLDVDDRWPQRLSGGEQQRLAVARALLARPDWLFLDEATASLDPASESELYDLMKQRLPKTTLVSIAHRPSVAAMHERHVTFDRQGEGPGRLVLEAPAVLVGD